VFSNLETKGIVNATEMSRTQYNTKQHNNSKKSKQRRVLLLSAALCVCELLLKLPWLSKIRQQAQQPAAQEHKRLGTASNTMSI
jgi:hypothetical protein